MKLTIKLNIGNYQSIDFTTNEIEDDSLEDLYWEVKSFLVGWRDYTENAQGLLNHIDKILQYCEAQKIKNRDPTPF